MSTINQYNASITDTTPLLGRLCWYSIPDQTVDHDSVKQICKANDLESYTPAPPRAPDVFRRACKESYRRVGRKEDPKRFVYELKQIDNDKDGILMKLVREEVDADTNVGINWHRLANVKFVRDTETIDVIELPDMDDTGRDVVKSLRATFNDENGKVNSAHIRRMVQQVLHDCLATAVRPSGGIYFVTEAHAAKVKKLKKCLDEMPHDASMHDLELIDTSDQRKMVHAAVEAELAGDIDSQLATVIDVLRSGEKISADKFTRLTSGLHYSGRKGAEYAKLLTDKLSLFESRKQVATDAIRKLADQVET